MEKKTYSKGIIISTAAFIAVMLISVFIWRQVEVIPGGHDARYHFPETTKYGLALSFSPVEIMDLVKQAPVRYPPLTFLTGGFFLLLTDFAPVSYPLTTIVFLLVMSLSLALLGWLYAKGNVVALLPLAVIWASPTMWEVAFSYNLEAALLAGALAILTMALYAAKIKSPTMFFLMVALAIPLVLSKTVVLISLAPALLALSFFPNNREKKIRFTLLLLVLAVSGAWILPRILEVAPEIAVDYENPHHGAQGIFYYPWLMLFDYRGFILIAPLLFFLWTRLKEKTFTTSDVAFSLFFLCPFIFYTFIDTKRPWYMLMGYSILPVWFLHFAISFWENKRVQILATVITLFYIVMAVANAVIAMVVSTKSFINGDPVLGLRRPLPMTLRESFLIDKIKKDSMDEPRNSFALFLTGGNFALDRIYAGLVLAMPGFVLNDRVKIADDGALNLENFIRGAPLSTLLYTLGESWPKIEPSVVLRDDKSIDLNALSLNLADARKYFVKTESFNGPDNLLVTRFAHKFPEDGYIHLNKMELTFYKDAPSLFPLFNSPVTRHGYDKLISGMKIIPGEKEKAGLTEKELKDMARLKEAARIFYKAGDFSKAADFLATVLSMSPVDLEARLLYGKSLVKSNKTAQAIFNLDIFFSTSTVFGQKLDALNDIARFEAENIIPWGTFHRFLKPVIKEYHGQKSLLYSLHSTKALYYQLVSDWNEVIKTLEEMAPYLTKEQTPGVNLSLAMAMAKNGDYENAVKLLNKNLAMVEKDNPVYFGSAFKLAQLLADRHSFGKSFLAIKKGAKVNFDQNSFVSAVIYVGGKMKNGKEYGAAKNLYLFALTKTVKDGAGKIEIELGNLAKEKSEKEEAKQYYLKALDKISDANIRKWVEEGLKEL